MTLTNVLGIAVASSYGQDLTFTLSAFGSVTLVGGFGVPLSTLSGLGGVKALAAYLAIMFFLVNAFSLAGLYREVKCSLPAMIAAPR
jgi:hypothetical protein